LSDIDLNLEQLESIFALAKRHGVSKLNMGILIVEFHPPAPVFEVVTPTDDATGTVEPSPYEAAAARLAGRKVPK